jgi:hypothetical protein
MIFGDPFKFAIQMDVVEEWSDFPTFVEGVVNVYINDIQLGDDYVFASTIFQDYDDIVNGLLANPPVVEEEYFSADISLILPEIIKTRHPWYAFDSKADYESKSDEWWSEVKEDLSKDATFETLLRKDYRLYVIKFNEMVRLMALKLDLDDGEYIDFSKFDYAGVLDVVVGVEYLSSLVKEVGDWHQKIMNYYAS